MSSIDNRVVQMGFENQKFESGIQTSIKSLESLNKSLKLDGAAKGLSGVEKSASKINLGPLSSAIDTVASRFTTMGIIGTTALVNVTNSAINAGKRMVSALTIDPVKMGFNEYETKMGSIQTILTNTAHAGTSLEEVNATLNELNTYADKTIYNFAEMTRNIGTFTAAGIDLKTSAEAIQGIANLAAGSGSNAEQASTAMYQLSQAMAAGSVKLQDWNSVVNAGMGGKLFQDALVKTGQAMGKNIKSSENFRESLQRGWLTTEVLTKTLQDFAKDESLLNAATQVKTFTQLWDTMQESVQSGWSQTWEYIIGDKDQATEMLTGISSAFESIIGPGAEARNVMFKFWNENGGRDAIIGAITNAFKALGSILSPIGKAFREVFPAMTGERLTEISKRIKEMTDKFKISEPTLNNIKRLFKGVFSVISVGVDLVKNIGKGFLDLVNVLVPVGGNFMEIAGNVGDFLTKMSETIKQSGIFKVVVSSAVDFVKAAIDGLKKAVEFVIDIFGRLFNIDIGGLKGLGEAITTNFKPFETLGNIIESVFTGIQWIFSKVGPAIQSFASFLGGVFKRIIDEVKTIFGGDGASMGDVINGGLLGALILGVYKLIKALKGLAEDAGGIIEGITDVLDGVKGSLEAYQNSLNANTLLKIAGAIGILALALVALGRLDGQSLLNALGAITVLFVELFAFMAVFIKTLGGKGFVGMFKASTAMLILAGAVSILAGAVKQMSDIGWDGLVQGLVGVAGAMAILVVASKTMEKNSKGMIKSGIALVIFGKAIQVLAKAVEKLGALDPETLTKGLVGVGVLLAELSLFIKTTKIDGMAMFKAVGILILAQALNVMANAVIKMSTLDLNQLGKGLLGVGGLLLQLSLFLKMTGGSSKTISTAIGLTILGGALLIMSKAIKNMGSLDYNVIVQGLLTMASTLTILAIGMKMMPKGMIGQAVAITILAGALNIIAGVIAKMGGLDWNVIVKGLITMGGALVTIGLAMKLMSGGIGAAVSLMVIAGAIRLLAPALERMGNLSLEQIGKGLLTLAGAFGVIGLAGLLLGPLVPILLGLAGAIVLLGIAAAAVGAGMLAFSAGMAALAVSGVAGGAALTAIFTSLIELIPLFMIKIAEGFVQLVAIIGENAPMIVQAFVNVLVSVITAIVEQTPFVISSFLNLITGVLTALGTAIPQLVSAAVQMVVGFINGIASQIGNVISAGVNLIISFVMGINNNIGRVVDVAFKTIIAFINGLATAIANNSGAIRSAVGNLIRSIAGAVTGMLGDIKNIGVNIIKGMMGGISSMASKLANSAMNVVKGAVRGVKSFLGIHSPSRLFAEIGMFTAQGMAVGLDDNASTVADSATGIGETAYNSLQSAMGSLSSALVGDMDVDPTIRPVMDLTNIQNGTKAMAGMLGNEYGISTSLNNASRAASSMRSNSISEGSVSVTPPTTNNNSTISNTFNITGSNAKEIANEVSRIIQRQVERREVVWA